MRSSDWSSDVCSSDLLGEGIGREAVRGFTLSVLLEACGRDVAGLRDAAILSLGYDAGLHVSELVAVAVELMAAPEDGSGLLERSEERRVGKECVSTCIFQWSPIH